MMGQLVDHGAGLLLSTGEEEDQTTEDRKQHTALQRVGQPPEIIGAALFLASDASSYTSGTIIRVDGGMY